MKSFMKHLQIKLPLGWLYALGLLFAVAAGMMGLLLGAANLTTGELLGALLGEEMGAAALILRYARLPRVLGSLLCGAALAVSGAVIQGVLANPLASPSIIGVNSGAGLAVTVCAAMGIAGGWWMSAFAFAGAFGAVMAVSLGAKKWGASRGTVILMGVAMNSLLGAMADGVVTLVPEAAMLRSDFRIGDFSAVTEAKLIPGVAVILGAMAVLLTLLNELDVLTLGEDTAKGLGLRTGRVRTVFLLLAAALAGAAVSIGGLLSFVGLLVPHTVRRMATGESRHLIPLCGLFGAGFVTFCDTLARTLFTPYELPVGILMAFLGAPFFLFVLLKGKGGRHHA